MTNHCPNCGVAGLALRSRRSGFHSARDSRLEDPRRWAGQGGPWRSDLQDWDRYPTRSTLHDAYHQERFGVSLRHQRRESPTHDHAGLIDFLHGLQVWGGREMMSHPLPCNTTRAVV